MTQLQAETRRKPLRISENKIRTLEVSEVDDRDRTRDEEPVTPTKPAAVNLSNGYHASF